MTTQAPTQHAWIYARYSDRPDAKTSKSNATQVEICRKHCLKEGYEISGHFEDEAKSGGSRKRKGLWAAIDALQRGDVLVAYSSSRLARSVYLCEIIYERIAKKRAFVDLIEDGGRVGMEPMQVCMRQVRAAFDELDRKTIGSRTRSAMRKHIADGFVMGTIPYGKREGQPIIDGERIRRTLEDDPDQQAVIQRIVSLSTNGHSLPPLKISRLLNKEGVPYLKGPWDARAVRRVLGREVPT